MKHIHSIEPESNQKQEPTTGKNPITTPNQGDGKLPHLTDEDIEALRFLSGILVVGKILRFQLATQGFYRKPKSDLFRYIFKTFDTVSVF